MRSFFTFCLVLTSLSLFAQTERKLANGQMPYYGKDFYQSKITKDSLYKILNEMHVISANGFDEINSLPCPTGAQCYRHTSVGYDGARKILFTELFGKTDSQGNYVTDVYCGKKFYFKDVADASNMHSQINIEHTWPQSKFNGNFDKNMQKSDMHHLYLADSMANNRRANHEFGEIESGTPNELNVQNCNSSRLSVRSGDLIFTPPPGHRGNVARSLFYFATRYKMFINPAEEIILRQWHLEDPVDEAEKSRHEIIAKYEKVRNPFVDFPELVEKVADF